MTQHETEDFCLIEDVFIHTVLGIPFPASCVMHEGSLQWCAIPVPKGAEPNLALIAEALRSPTPLHPRILGWIADLFDKNREGGYKIERLKKQKKSGAKKSGAKNQGGVSSNWYLVDYVADLLHKEEKRKSLIEKKLPEYEKRLVAKGNCTKKEAKEHIALLRGKLLNRSMTRERAIEAVSKKFKVSARTIDYALASHAAALDEHERLNKENRRKIRVQKST